MKSCLLYISGEDRRH